MPEEDMLEQAENKEFLEKLCKSVSAALPARSVVSITHTPARDRARW